MEYTLTVNYRHGEEIKTLGIGSFTDLQNEIMHLTNRNQAVFGEISQTTALDTLGGIK